MTKSIEDLEKLLRLLRAQGVYEFKMGDMHLKLGDLPDAQVQHAEGEPAEGFPSQLDLDKAVGMPVQGFDDPFLDYSVSPEPDVPVEGEPINENSEA